MSEILKSDLRMIAWEVTRSCNLSCIHCRASAEHGPYEGELSTEECFELLDEIASFAKPVIILTGGEPLLREDIYDIAAKGRDLGLRMVMAPNGTLVNPESVKRIKESGISRISLSLDGATAEAHDEFRQVKGAFEAVREAAKACREGGLEFQINSTITKRNYGELPRLLELTKELGGAAHHIFLLVPTGRGKDLEAEEISAEDYEKALNWLYDRKKDSGIELKATCAPHYYRIMRQRAVEEGIKITPQTHGREAMTRGCMGGVSFCFVSHVGQLSPCGYLELDCGNVRVEGFRKAWETSPVFQHLRDHGEYKGKCGICEFRKVCGGCRARAYAATGDYLEPEPYCAYEPRSKCG